MSSTAPDSSEVVGLIYQAVLAPPLWQDALTKLCDRFQASAGHIMIGQAGDAPPVRLAARSWSDEGMALWAAHYASVDPFLLEARRRRHSNVILSQDILTDQELDNSEIYADFSRHYGGGYHLMGATVNLPDARSAHLVFHRERSATHFEERARLDLAGIAFHAHHALRMRLQLDQSFAANDVRSAVLDTLPHGVIVASADSRVVYINRRAERYAAEGGLRIGLRGMLSAQTLDLDGRLRTLIHAACGGAAGGNLRLAGVTGDTVLSIAPLPMALANQLPSSRRMQPGLALITLRRLRTTAAVRIGPIRDLFGLTAAEGRIVPHLLAGRSVEWIARSRGVSPATIRTQIRGVLTKTETTSLRALAALLLPLADAD